MSHGSSEKNEPNFTPLLDLVLQLVMFFMLCAKIVVDQTGVEIKLPEANSAKAVDAGEEYQIYLNVNLDGDVIFAPNSRPKDSKGEEISVVKNPAELQVIMARRAEEDIAAAGPAGKDKPPRSLVILRIDERCPFEKVSPIIDAVRSAGYVRVQMRAELAAAPVGR